MMLDSVKYRIQEVESVFSMAGRYPSDSAELEHWTRYLCVLSSATLQSSLHSILNEYVRSSSNITVQRFVRVQLDRTRNPSPSESVGLPREFDEQWAQDVRRFMKGEKADAIRSIVSNRNNVSHGRTCTATIRDLRNWFDHAKKVIQFCHDLVLGKPRMDGGKLTQNSSGSLETP